MDADFAVEFEGVAGTVEIVEEEVSFCNQPARQSLYCQDTSHRMLAFAEDMAYSDSIAINFSEY